MFEMARTMQAEYTDVESWIYDRLIAPAIVPHVHSMMGDIIDEVGKGSRLLDVGCGGGHLLLTAAELRPDLSLTGVDLNPGQIHRAKKRASHQHKDIRFIEGSATNLPFTDRTFDAVVSVASIKHWPDQLKGLAEIVRVLKPGGMFFVVEVDRGCQLEDARAFVSGMRLPKPLLELGMAGFRTYVAGQSWDLEDARALSKKLNASKKSVERLKGVPAIGLRGFRKK